MKGIVKTLIIVLVVLIALDAVLIFIADNIDFDSGNFLGGLGGATNPNNTNGDNWLNGDTGNSQGSFLGSNFDTAIVIEAKNEGEGLSKEHEWLANNACIGKSPEQDLYEELIKHNGSWYDKFIITCSDGSKETYYFNIDSFNGVWE